MHTDPNRAVPDFASFRQLSTHHQTVQAVLADPELERYEKRAILSSWASDRYAVESTPWLRRIPGLRDAISLSDIFAALRSLDDDDPPPRGGMAMRLAGSCAEREPAFG